MKYSEATLGRTFIIRLEDGDILHESLEQFAADHNIKRAYVTAVGGADKGSTLVVGPRESRSSTIEAMEHVLHDTHEVTGTGTIFPDSQGTPVLHMHTACGRNEQTITGCVRTGVRVWHVLEVIMVELINSSACRKKDPATGFDLLEP